jgi:hypothetical protein
MKTVSKLGSVMNPLEAVRDDQCETGLGGGTLGDEGVSSGPVRVVPVLAGVAESVGVEECGRLVQHREHGHHLPVERVGVFGRQALHDLLGSEDVVGVVGPED